LAVAAVAIVAICVGVPVALTTGQTAASAQGKYHIDS